MGVTDRIVELVCEQLGATQEQVSPEASFTEELGASAENKAKAIQAVAAEYSLKMPDEDRDKIQTFGDLVRYVTVAEIVAKQLGVEKERISGATSFANDLGADSLDTVELVMEFEENFGFSIPDTDAEKIQTIGQALDYIAERQTSAE